MAIIYDKISSTAYANISADLIEVETVIDPYAGNCNYIRQPLTEYIRARDDQSYRITSDQNINNKMFTDGTQVALATASCNLPLLDMILMSRLFRFLNFFFHWYWIDIDLTNLTYQLFPANSLLSQTDWHPMYSEDYKHRRKIYKAQLAKLRAQNKSLKDLAPKYLVMVKNLGYDCRW